MFGFNESAWFSLFAVTALKSAAVLTAAWLAATLLRGRSAAARHLVWTAAFAALLALPFLYVSLPPLRVASKFLSPNISFQSTTIAKADATTARHAGAGVTSPAQPASRRPGLLFWLMLLWAAGTAAALLQTVVAMISMARVRRQSRSFREPDLEPLSQALGIQHQVELLEAHRGSMPMTFGLLRPAVFMPADAAQWSQDRRQMVLLHELAHVRRGDVAMHLLARTALNLYWWNPLAWTAWHAFLKERERAADDLVLSAGARASEYAGHLLEIARTMQASPAIGWAAVAMARPSQLEGRLLAILDGRVNRKTPGRAGAVAAALLAIAIVAPLAAVQSQDEARPVLPADINATFRVATAQKNNVMLEDAAKAAETLKQYEVAQKLLESAVAIRQQVSGDRSVEYGVGLVKLGDLEFDRHKRQESDAFYTKAVSVLGDRPEAAPALLHLGINAFARKDFEAAVGYFQQVQIADPSKAGEAMTWTAVVRQRQGDVAQAESLYRGALAVENDKTAEAAATMDLYAAMLKETNRLDEATQMQARAAETRKAARVTSSVSSSTGVYRVGGGVTAPKLAYKVEPEYSEEARAAKYQGTVVVYVEIGPDGLAHNARVIQSLGLGLDQKAVDALNQWKFTPGTKDGLAVTVAATIEVNFRLL
jgi:TonB family protein